MASETKHAGAATAARQTFLHVAGEVAFPKQEEDTLKYWNEIKAFETSLVESKDKPIYTFYDGPPFATGLPHYGHILAGTIKDIVTRYAHQTGHYVGRRFGWDCHGLPIEYEIDKKLGITGPDDVLKMGIDKYNAECRAIVMRYSSEWQVVVKRMGRWIDFENDYKTMNHWFMESVWWVFKQMFDKGLVFEGVKVMPYSTGCNTPISNFEAGENYRDVQDPAVVVTFPLVDDPSTSFLAWTTTPWTLPSNLALCLSPELKYVKVKDAKTGHNYILAEVRLSQIYKSVKPPQLDANGKPIAAETESADAKKKPKENKKKKDGKSEEDSGAKAEEPAADKEFDLIATYSAKDLEGKRYVPLFDSFKDRYPNAFRVVVDPYVTGDSGVGVVHNAPGHGEDDYRVCMANGIITKDGYVACPVDSKGCFTEEVKEFYKVYVKDADRKIIRLLKERGRLIQDSQITHPYPHCWRSDTPLIYKAVPSWFVDVPKIKEQLLANNAKTYWVPEFVKEKRFHNWLRDAREWSVSRDRFWGTPIPIWRSDDNKEIVVIGSIQELEKLSGASGLTDIHRDKIDHLTIPSKRGPEFGVLKRVPQVFDCWFESGSMPYAQLHYPFENQEQFKQGFPADFIAEGLDQTRGWFYTLMVISTALFNEPAFKNLIVNGLVLAADGKKMSKRLKNYDPPMEVVNLHGADAVRLYLINSPVVRAEPLRFVTDGVKEVVRNVLIPWWNAYKLFVEQARRHNKLSGTVFTVDAHVYNKSSNVMDRWILAAFNSLVGFVRKEMADYHLYTVVPGLLSFLDQLTNWYLRFNKTRRLKGLDGPVEAQNSLATLFEVLHGMCKLMAPFTPFIVEAMYQNLKKALPTKDQKASVHFLDVPTVDEGAKNEKIEKSVKNMQNVILLGRTAREKINVGGRTPLLEARVVVRVDEDGSSTLSDLKELESYITGELNVRKLHLTSDMHDCQYKVEPNRKSLGQRLKGEMGAACKAIRELGSKDVRQLEKMGEMKLPNGVTVTKEDVIISWDFVGDSNTWQVESDSSVGVMVMLHRTPDADCVEEGHAREFMARVQKLRKSANLKSEDVVTVFFEFEGPAPVMEKALQHKGDIVQEKLRLLPEAKRPKDGKLVGEEKFDLQGEKIIIRLVEGVHA